MVKTNYPCSQSALYQVSRNIAASLTDYLTDFVAFKAKYIAAFVTTLETKITYAEGLPDFQARSAQSEVDYIDLGTALTECTSLWQNLKRYIVSAYPGPEQKARLEEAGANEYERAIQKKWDAANSLLTSASNFLTLHQTELEAGMNMPTTFKATFDTARTAFNAALIKFQQGSEDLKTDTALKINTNNELYALVMDICLDGQQVFKNNIPLKDQFTFSTVLELVSGIGSTGFKGYVTDAVTNLPVAGVNISTVPPTKTVVSDAAGYYEFLQVAAGTYQLNADKGGYAPFTMPGLQVDAGILHNVGIIIVPV